MGAYLEARGRQVDLLFGFVRDARLALVASPLFLEGTTLDADPQGIVRCRLAGRPSALVPIGSSIHLDVTELARIWPSLHAELVERAGADVAAALVATAPLVRPLDDLTSVILEHSVRAEDLHVLGERPRAPHEREGHMSFRFAFEAGELELSYDAEARVPKAAECEVRWKGAVVEWPRACDFPWNDDDVAELALLGSMRVRTHPEDVVALYASVCDEAFDALGPSLALASVLDLRGVALRKTGALEAAVEMLERAYAMAVRLDPKLEQQVAYNLGYALLETTMRSRVGLSETDGNEVAIADYRIDASHRDRWKACLVLFERALALDPSDVTARSQVRHVEMLLAALDGDDRGATGELPARGPATKTPRATSSEGTPPAASTSLAKDLWIPMGIVVAVVLVVLVLHSLSKDSPRVDFPVTKTSTAPSAKVPSARELSERARLAALSSIEKERLSFGSAPCPLAIEPPRVPPRGEVLAPPFGRAPGTGELYGTDYFDATIRHYADRFAPELDVRPAFGTAKGPLTGAEGPPGGRLDFRPFATTLIVLQWHDPVVLAGGTSLTPGRVTARLVAWSYADSRFVCASEVEASNAAGLVIVRSPDLSLPADDPLGRARLDLVEQAYRAAIPRLRALDASDAGASSATATGRGDASP